MFLGIRRQYWWCLAASVMMIAGMLFLHTYSAFALKTSEVEGPLAEKIKLGGKLHPGENVFRIDTGHLADTLLKSQAIENVTLYLNLPSGLMAEINQFEPVALVLTDKLYGLDIYSRLIPFDSAWETINLPVMTGLKSGNLFVIPGDYRIAGVVKGLEAVKEEIPALYQQIAEIDFSQKECVKIFLSSGQETFLARSQDFRDQLLKLYAVREMAIAIDGGCYNLQFDDVVIKQ